MVTGRTRRVCQLQDVVARLDVAGSDEEGEGGTEDGVSIRFESGSPLSSHAAVLRPVEHKLAAAVGRVVGTMLQLRTLSPARGGASGNSPPENARWVEQRGGRVRSDCVMYTLYSRCILYKMYTYTLD